MRRPVSTRPGRRCWRGGAGSGLVDRLCLLVEQGDDLSVARLRPYALASLWGVDRRPVLELCLEATRAGLLELRWELLCPLCRGPSAVGETLDDAAGTVHCETCLIDFAAEFDRSVEIAFRPSPAIREVGDVDFCVAGPQVTRHVVAQELLAPGDGRPLALRLEPGSYRLRALGLPGTLPVVVGGDGQAKAVARPEPAGWPAGTLELAEEATIELENADRRASSWSCSSAPRGATRRPPPPR